MMAEIAKLNRVEGEYPFIRPNKGLPVCIGYHLQVTDHPTTVFVLPVIGQANENIMLIDIREEGKSPAGQRTIVTLTMLVPKTFD